MLVRQSNTSSPSFSPKWKLHVQRQETHHSPATQFVVYLNNIPNFKRKCLYSAQLSQRSWLTYPENRTGMSGSPPPQEKCSAWTAAPVPLSTKCGSGGGWAIQATGRAKRHGQHGGQGSLQWSHNCKYFWIKTSAFLRGNFQYWQFDIQSFGSNSS